MASNTGYASLGSDHELDNLSKSSKRLSSTRREIQRKRRVAWLPWLILAAVLNLFFLCSMIYGIAYLSGYRHRSAQWFLISWLIFGVPSLFVAFLVVTPFPVQLREARRELSQYSASPSYIPIVNFLNATFCLLTVMVYLYVGAYPDWSSAQWNNKVEYRQHLPIPGFAFVYWYTSTGETYYPVKSSDPLAPQYMFECQVANMSDTTNKTYDCTSALNWTKIGGYNMHVFDPRRLPVEHSTINDLQTQIWLQSWVKYDSRIANTYASPMTTSMGGIFFDPNMNLSKGFECGFLKIATMPVFATTYASIELTETQDRYDLLDLGANTTRNGVDCTDLRQAVFGKGDDDEYLSWTSGFSSMQRPNISDCDVKQSGNDSGCPIALSISYSSHIVNKALTQPGTDKLTIWLNAGAVVGGVQFFFWFLTMFAQT